MASTSRSPRQVSTPVPAGLPLGLQPYHLLFSGTVISIVLLGTLYSLLTGSHLYNTHIAPGAHLPFDDSAAQAGLQRPASLFADKRNIFNQLFVKQAWFWTTCVVVLQAWTMRSSAGSEPGGATGATGETPSEVAKGKRKAEEGDENEGEGDKGHAPVPARAPPATISSPMARSILRWFISTCCWGKYDILSVLFRSARFLDT